MSNQMTDKENIVDFPASDALEEEAALWVMRLDGGALAAEDQAELNAWLRQNPRNKDAFERMAAMWGMADLLETYNRIDPMEECGGREAQESFPVRRKVLTGAIAASLALVVAAVATQRDTIFPSRQTETVRTAIGEQRAVDLADGSVMILNTNSEARIEIARAARTVTLAKGEAHFEVAKDKTRPFRVYAGEGLVEAVGTAFTVRLRERREVEVTVAEGVVELFSKEPPGAPDKTVSKERGYRSLAALAVNENAVFDEKIERREKMDEAALARKLMWRDGFLAFSGEPLADVVSEMSRYTDLKIDIADPELARLPIAGSFEAGNIKGMFDSLEKVFGVTAQETAPGHVTLARGA